MQRAARGILCLSLLLAVARDARAADAAGGAAAAERDAEARFEEGIARVRAGDFEGAYVSFSMAQAVMHKPAILWNLALAEEKTHRTLAALAHFKEYWRETSISDVHRASVVKHIEDISAITGHIDVVSPAGAQLTVDGAAAGVLPLDGPLDVLPGHHLVESRLAGTTRSMAVDVAAGQTVQATLVETAPPAAVPGGATESMGSAAEGSAAPASGEQPARLAPNAAKLITVTAAGGAALVFAGLGVVFALRSQSDANDASALRSGQPDSSCQGLSTGRCASLKNAVDAQSSDTALAVGLYATAGVLAAGAVATWFLWPKPAASARASIAPLANANAAGLQVVGSF
jgi:hypothetical protein